MGIIQIFLFLLINEVSGYAFFLQSLLLFEPCNCFPPIMINITSACFDDVFMISLIL